MRTLVRKVLVESLGPTVMESDNIEVAHIGKEVEKDGVKTIERTGWQCVVKKGEFKPGDVGVYFEIDSALPLDDERFSFLNNQNNLKEFKDDNGVVKDKCIRIRTQEFRKTLSQGLLLQALLFPELDGVPLETDCADLLHVRHFDKIVALYIKDDNGKGLFPSFLPSTDLERIQNLPQYFEELQDMEFELTRKVDGSSMTVFYAPNYRADDPFGVCANSLEHKMDSKTSLYVRLANELGLFAKLRKSFEQDGIELALQGELNGLGIQKNRDKLNKVEFRVFSIYNVTKQCYLTPEERIQWCEKHDVPHVQVLARHFKPFAQFKSMDEILAYSDGLSENGNPREGIVYKQEDCGVKPIFFKAVSNKYLLKEK